MTNSALPIAEVSLKSMPSMLVISLVQLVHYPLYKKIDTDSFSEYQILHIKLITPLVGPIMIAELVTSFLLFLNYSNGVFNIAFALILIIWLTTVLKSIPNHQKLTEGWNEKLFKELLAFNWIRTVSWILRTLLLSFFLSNIMSSWQ